MHRLLHACLRLPVRVCLAGLALLACGTPDELQGTYDQQTPIPASERYAYRLSLFRFGDRVGGVARFYEIQGTGPAGSNTVLNPYLYESFCTHFGDVPLSSGDFAFEVPSGPGGQSFNFLVTSLEAERVEAQVDMALPPGQPTRSEITLDRTGTAVDRHCSSAFEVIVDLPQVTIQEAPDLALAAVFAGYERTPETQERLITRSTVDAYPVVEANGTEYATIQRIPFPRVPDEDGLSDPLDGVLFGLGYIVLFNDGNHDGLFSHRISGDVVLALSPRRVALYVAGDPAGLDPSIQARFETASDIVSGPGYGLYSSANVEVEGETAYIQELFVLPTDARIRVERLDEENPEAFPVLLPASPDEEAASAP